MFKMTKGNTNLDITAEFVALIKSRKNSDYNYLVSSKARRLFNIFNLFFEKTLNKTFQDRIDLSNSFDEIINSSSCDNIADLGAGFSLRGFNNKKNYFDLDFPRVIQLKKSFLLKLCKNKNKNLPKNYRLINCDLLKNIALTRKGKTLFFAEGVVSYFNSSEFNLFINNLFKVMKKGDVFVYNERWERNKRFSYRFIRLFLSWISKSRSYLHFNSKSEAREYFFKRGFSRVYFLNKSGFNFIKLIK